MTNVNLAGQLDKARKQQLPSSDKKYVIRHKGSELLLTVSTDQLVVMQDGVINEGQHYQFIAADSDNGVYLKAANNLYVSLGTTENSAMIGCESVTNGGWSTCNISVADGCYYIHTIAGLMGTNPSMSDGRVYADNSADSPEELHCSAWLIEEYVDVLADVKAALAEMLAQAEDDWGTLSVRWTGSKPMQYSRDNYNALKEVIAEAESCAYTSVEEYEDLMQRLSDAMEAMKVLNVPDEDTEYYLSHQSGYNLSCADGLVFAEPDTLDAAQRFRLLPVPDAVNTYYIYTNGLYVTVTDAENATLALTETPRDERGQFVASQVSSSAFTLQGVLGYLGAETTTVEAGEACVGDVAQMGRNVYWKLVEATNPIVENGIAPQDYASLIDYVVVYDKDTESLRFESPDMSVLSEVKVQVYTVGGRLLYTFKASEQQSLAELPGGTYIVNWSLGTTARSVKFKK